MTVLHSTEPATVYLSLFARVEGLSVGDVDRVLYEDRTLVKQLAMRRTLFVFPRELLPAAWGSASARVAATQERRLAKEAVAAGLAADGERWLDAACRAVLDRLSEGPAGAQEIREEVPEVAGSVTYAPGTKWGGEVPIAPQVLTILGSRGAIVRGVNGGHWRISRPVWTRMSDWLGDVPEPLDEDAGYAELVRRALWTFGPATTKDLQWWLGSTVTAVRRALVDVGAVEVSLDRGQTGWVLADDVEGIEPVAPWAALLPVLDPTTMGWKDRDFYLESEHAPYLFDTNGNAGSTAWWDGRIVGCWVQDEVGVVRTVLRESVGVEATAALAAEADRLTAWLDGLRIASVYTSLQMKSARLP